MFFQNNPTERSKGLILNPTEEQAGPKTFNTSGYDPIEININQEGYLDVYFYPSNTTAPAKATLYNSAFLHNGTYFAGNANNHTNSCTSVTTKFYDGVAAWDITVVGTDGQKKDGRVFTDHFKFMHNGGNNTLFNGYILTNDGYIYKIETRKISGIDWYFFANNRGIINPSKNKIFYGSAYKAMLNSAGSSYLTSGGYTQEGIKKGFITYFPTNLYFDENQYGDVAYRLFLNYPDADLLNYINPELFIRF